MGAPENLGGGSSLALDKPLEKKPMIRKIWGTLTDPSQSNSVKPKSPKGGSIKTENTARKGNDSDTGNTRISISSQLFKEVNGTGTGAQFKSVMTIERPRKRSQVPSIPEAMMKKSKK